MLILITFLAPIITALTTIFKTYINEKYYALIPLVIGLLLGPAVYTLIPFLGLEAISLINLIWVGLLSGLSAAGLYSAQNIRNK